MFFKSIFVKILNKNLTKRTMLINPLKKLDLVFELQGKNQTDYVITTQDDHDTKTVKLVLGKRGKAGEATDVHVINILALTLLGLFGPSGKNLFKEMHDPQSGKEIVRIVDRLYIEMLIRHNKLTFPGVEYSHESPVLQALSIMKRCGQASKLHIAQLALLSTRGEKAESNLINQNILDQHLTFHTLQLELMEAIQPFLRHIQKEQLLISTCKEAGLSSDALFSSSYSTEKNKIPALSENTTVQSERLNENERKLHHKIQQIISRWAESSSAPSLKMLVSWIQDALTSSSIPLPLDKKSMALIRSYYLLAENWLEKKQLTSELLTKYSQTLQKFEKLIQASPVLYHKVHGRKLLSAFQLMHLITLPFSPSYTAIDKEAITGGLFSASLALATLRNRPPEIDTNVVNFINQQKLASARYAFKSTLLELRSAIVQSFKSDLLQEWFQKPLINKVRDLYTSCYHTSSSEKRENHLSPQALFNRMVKIKRDVKPPAPALDSFFSQEKIEALAVTKKMEQLSLTAASSKSKYSKKRSSQNNHEEKEDLIISNSTLQYDFAETSIEDELIYSTEEPLPPETTPQKIEFFWRVQRWSVLGYRVFSDDQSYVSLKEEDYPEMLFRHTLFPEVDDRIDTLFSHFSWNTPTGKCLLYTAPAELDFQGKKTHGFIEYAFTIERTENGKEKRGACFHKYFSPKKESLSHQLAEKNYLERDLKPISEEEKGYWQISGSKTQVVEREASVSLFDESAHICLTIFR